VPKPRRCHFATRTGTTTEYSVSLTEYWVAAPLDAVFQEDEEDGFPHSRGLKRYRVEVMADRFEPGRCQWNLDRVVYSAGDDAESSQLFGFQDDGRGRWGENQFLPVWFLHVWCTKLPATRETSAHEACSGPRPPSPDATDIALFPDKDVMHLVLGRAHPEIGIEFHDVDRAVPASRIID